MKESLPKDKKISEAAARECFQWAEKNVHALFVSMEMDAQKIAAKYNDFATPAHAMSWLFQLAFQKIVYNAFKGGVSEDILLYQIESLKTAKSSDINFDQDFNAKYDLGIPDDIFDQK